MALKDVPKGSKSHKRLQVVLEASEQVKDLVSRILSFSRKEEFHKEKINLAKCIRSGIKLLRSTVPSSLIIRPHIKNIGDVFADQTQINVVLVNLAVNARDAMVGGTGEMSISLTKHIATKMDAALPNIKENAPYAVIRVKDSGCGMTKDVLPRVFDPFFTTKPPGEGTGLGLSIVYGVVARHDGGIRIRSKEGKGTTFEIFLPFFG